MSWAVGYDSDHHRWRGYGVPALCDARCGEAIDRGFAYICPCPKHVDQDETEVNVFVCGRHTCADVDQNNLPSEHPDWVRHLLNDDSWARWREENPAKVEALIGGEGRG